MKPLFLLASLLALSASIGAESGRAYDEPHRDEAILRYNMYNYSVLDLQYGYIKESYIIKTISIEHPETKEKVNKILFYYYSSSEPYECSGNEWYLANTGGIYQKDIIYNINNEYYIKEELPQFLMDVNNKLNLDYKSIKPLNYDLSVMMYDYSTGRRPKYSIDDTVNLEDWQITTFTPIKLEADNIILYDLNNHNSPIRVPYGVNIIFLRSNNYYSEVNFKDKNDKCWPMAIDEESHKVVGWLDQTVSFDEVHGFSPFYDTDRDSILVGFPRR
jgi:hypothetical protein